MEKTATLAPETAINEKLDFIIEAINSLQQELSDLRDRIEGPDIDDGRDPAELFEKAWRSAMSGVPRHPIETLWDGIDAE